MSHDTDYRGQPELLSNPYLPNTASIPNIFFDYWMSKLSHAEFKILMAIARKTYGWHKNRDRISLRQLSELTGIHKTNVVKATERLIEIGIVLKFKSKDQYGDLPNEYEINVERVEKKIEGTAKHRGESSVTLPPPSSVTLPPPSSVTLPTKSTITKPTKQKENIGASQPARSFSFGKFVEMDMTAYEELCQKHGKERIDLLIEELEDYIPNMPQGKKYRDHAAVIRSWLRRQGKTHPKEIPLQTEEKEARIKKNRARAETAEQKLKDQFTGRVHFTANAEMCILVNANKDLTKKYMYESLEPNLFMQSLIRDLESNFRDVRKILIG
jgi:phage replication O-like protein O